MANKNRIRTWRERIGVSADFPLHAPTDVERAMEAEIAELRARLAPRRDHRATGQSSGEFPPEIESLLSGYRKAGYLRKAMAADEKEIGS